MKKLDQPVYIWGAGGHAKVVADILMSMLIEVDGFIDDADVQPGQLLMNRPVLASSSLPLDLHFSCVLAIGVNEVRETVANRIKERFQHCQWINAIHARAVVSPSADVGQGVVIAAQAVVGPYARVGDHAVINTASSLDHDSTLEAFASLAPGVIVGGGADIGRRSYIGLGARIIHGMSVGEDTVVGSGSAVVRSIPSCVVAYGAPCRVVRTRKAGDRYL